MMTSLSPPAKTSRLQTMDSSEVSLVRPGAGGGRNTGGASGVFIAGLPPRRQIARVGGAGVGPSLAWVVDDQTRTAHVWKISGSAAAAPSAIPLGNDADVDFLAEGFDGKSLVACSSRGRISFIGRDAADTVFDIFRSDGGHEDGGAAVVGFVSAPRERRVFVAVTQGGIVAVTFEAARIRVCATNLTPRSGRAQSGSQSSGGRSGGGSGGAASWFSSWFGGKSKSRDLDDQPGPIDLSASLPPSDAEAAVDITAIAVSPIDPSVLFAATSANTLCCLRVADASISTVWQTAVSDAAVAHGAILALTATRDGMVHVVFGDNGANSSESGQRGLVMSFAAETGNRTARAQYSAKDTSGASSGAAAAHDATQQLSFRGAATPGNSVFITATSKDTADVILRRSAIRVPLETAARAQTKAQHSSFDAVVLAAGVSELLSTIVVTAHGPRILAARTGGNDDASSAAGAMATALATIQASLNGHVSIDDACISACDDVATTVSANPANWARGDVDAEDINLLTYVTSKLVARQEQHRGLVEAITADPEIGPRLKPRTVGDIISQQERLVALAAIRNLQNVTTGSAALDRDLAALLKAAIVDVAQGLRTDASSQLMSSAEIFFQHDRNVVPLLATLNEIHRSVHSAANPLQVKLEQALAISTIAAAVCDAVEASRRTLPVPESAAQFMWTAALSKDEVTFESVLSYQMVLAADTLQLSVDVRRTDIDGITAAAAATLDGVERDLLDRLRTVIEFLFRHHPLRSLNTCSVSLRRTLFCPPFYIPPMGYPYGEPATDPAFGVAFHVGKVVEDLALRFEVFDVLCDLSLSTRVENPTQTPSEYTRFRRFCDDRPALFEFALGWLLDLKRENEAEHLHEVAPNVAGGLQIRDHFLSTKAPHVHWVVDKTAYKSLLKASRLPDHPLIAGGTRVECRHANLALAKLAWIAEGRPHAFKYNIDQDLAIVKAQKRFLPDHADGLVAAHEIAGALIGIYTKNPAKPDAQEALLAAASIASAIVDDDIRRPLLYDALRQSVELDDADAKLQHIRGGAAGEAEMTARINELLAARILRASPILRREIFSPDGGDVKATLERQPEVFATLLAWAKVSFISK